MEETKSYYVRPWDQFCATTYLQLAGVVVWVVMALVMAVFVGFAVVLRNAEVAAPLVASFAGDKVVDPFRDKPPGRWGAAAAGLLTWFGMAGLGMTVALLLSLGETGEGLGVFVGSFLGCSCGTAVFAWVVDRVGKNPGHGASDAAEGHSPSKP